MASGFIEISENKEFAVRWTIYDEILRLLIQELKAFQDLNSIFVVSLLESRTPPPNFDENLEMGWGFITEHDVISRIVSITDFSIEQKEVFWKAVHIAYTKLQKQGKNYSTLQPVFLKELLDMQ